VGQCFHFVPHDSRTKDLYLLYSLPRQEQQKEREREREGGRDREAGRGKRGERDGEKETHWWQAYGEGLRRPSTNTFFVQFSEVRSSTLHRRLLESRKLNKLIN
jgi:hypothetical protein